jgi:hypothetical protein
MPDGHDGRSASVPIVDGQYLIEKADGPNFGKYKVKIYGFEGGRSGSEEERGSDERTIESGSEQRIPAKYNEATELTLNVSEVEVHRDWTLTP